MTTPTPNARDRGLRRLRLVTSALTGGSVAALVSASYVAAMTIPGADVAATKVASVSTSTTPAATATTTTTTTTTTTDTTPTPAATPVPTPTPTQSKPVAVSGGSK